MITSTRLTNSDGRRRRARFAIAAACLLVSCGAPEASNWKTFSPEGSAFTVLVPGVPERDRQYGKNESGTIETNVYTLVLPEGGVYMIVDSILPPNADVKNGADGLLDSAADRQVESANGRLVSKQTIFLNDRPGRQIEAEVPESSVPGGATLKGRVYLGGTRLYEVIAIVPKPEASSASTTRFLESFQLKEPQR